MQYYLDLDTMCQRWYSLLWHNSAPILQAINFETVDKPQPRTQQLCDTLEDDIVNGRIAPGARLDEVRLSQRFAVSRTPIREALRQLAATGLVESVPRRGTFVAQLGLPQIIEMFEVMAELEGMCGRLSARRIAPEQRTRLLDRLVACRIAAEAGISDDYYYENEQFHHVIYESSHNRFLADQARQLHTRLKPYRRLQLRVPQRMRSSFDEHKAIVDAIVTGDEETAESLLKNHVLIQGERFADLVSIINTRPVPSAGPESATA